MWFIKRAWAACGGSGSQVRKIPLPGVRDGNNFVPRSFVSHVSTGAHRLLVSSRSCVTSVRALFLLFSVAFCSSLSQMALNKSKVTSPDFSQPWKLSDLVLVVEEERFHVHKAMLALWSPVFEKMFTSEFQEMSKNEVPLPGKKASEMKELLLMMYPSADPIVTGRAITKESCYFLVKLAHEYQMEAVIARCENFMAQKVGMAEKESVLADLIFAQTYKLEKLKLASVAQAHCLSLDELKEDEMFDQIQKDNLKEIMEGIIKRLQSELDESRNLAKERQGKVEKLEWIIQRVKTSSLDHLNNLAEFLVTHVSYKHVRSRYGYFSFSDVNSYIAALEMDGKGHFCRCDKCNGVWICNGLNDVTRCLISIKNEIERFSNP